MGRGIAWLTLAMVVVGVWNTLARWAGRTIGVDLASNGLIEAQWYMFSLLFLLGAAHTLREGGHVRVDVLFSRMSKRRQAIVDLVGTIVFLIPFCFASLWFSWPSVAESWNIGEMSPDPGGLPRYPLKAVVPVAFVMLIVQGISEIGKRILVLAGHGPTEVEEREPDPEGER